MFYVYKDKFKIGLLEEQEQKQDSKKKRKKKVVCLKKWISCEKLKNIPE